MARFSPAETIYEVADLFRQRCLVAGQSLLWPDRHAWTVGTIDALVGAFVDRDDSSEGTFLAKLHDQLAKESDDVLRVAADVLAFYFLFPSSKSVGRRRKLDTIQTIVNWRPAALAIAPSEWGLLEAAFVEGAGSTGSDYLTGRPAHLAFFLAFARGVLEGKADPYDPDSCRRLIAELGLQLNGRTQARHVLLHLLFPDQFERTASEAHKTKMVTAFRDDAGGGQDLDDALANIRKALTQRLGRDDLDFYEPDLRPLWDAESPQASPEIGEITAIRQAVAAMYPDPDVRRMCLTVFADSIESAHAVSPASWMARFARDERAVRLNVSWSQACVLSQDDLYIVLDADAIDAPTMEQITAMAVEGHRGGAAYSSIPFAYGVHLSATGLEASLPIVLGAHRSFISRSAKQVRTRTHFFRSHAPEVVEYLQRELGRDLPQPDYGLSAQVAQRIWLFQANPAVWNLAEKLRDRSVGDDETWSVSRFRNEMGPGQLAVLWMGGENAGVYALGELVDAPFERRTADFWPDRSERGETEWAVPFVYTQILDRPITKTALLAHPVLKDLSVIRGPMGTNFKITPEQWQALQELIEAVDNGGTSLPQVWVEKTITRGRPDRLSGEYAMGKMLWSPQRDKRGGDIYRFMREVQPGDIVLHLTDNEAFTAVSRAAGAAEEFGGVPSTAWDEQPSYRIRLHDCTELNPPLSRDVFFASPYRERLVTLINAGTRNLFFNQGPTLNQGAYLTPAPPDLVAILEGAYREQTGKNLIPRDWTGPGEVTPRREVPTLAPGPTLEDLAALTHLDRQDIEELEALLLDKRQLVLEGPPGAGKTFLAEHVARFFAGLPLNGAHDERVETVQFHQSYGYEDFVQGIRPVTDEHGQLQYHVLPGIFMRMCDLAARNPDQRFVLIIDEINRGNLSRIFGELLLLLEYRDKRVRLPFGAVDGKEDQAYLSIPRNLYLIGTMNSTDRSLALIDYALRRRFYFYRLLPVVDGRAPVLERWLTARGVIAQDRERAVQIFVNLNREVERHLGSEFQIGHSYFMRDDIGSDAGMDRLWRRAIMPLLEEYLHGARDRESVLTGLAWRQLLATPVPELEPSAASLETV
jgi:MoxR-like ATPase